MNVEKTTVVKIVANYYNTKRLSIDNPRCDYYNEIGNDEEKAESLMKLGHKELMEYWEPFQGHAVSV